MSLHSSFCVFVRLVVVAEAFLFEGSTDDHTPWLIYPLPQAQLYGLKDLLFLFEEGGQGRIVRFLQ